MVTAATLPRLGVKLGDTVQLSTPAPTTMTIVGVLDYGPAANSDQTFFGREDALSDISTADRLQLTAFYLPDTVLDWTAVQKLNTEGAVVLSRSVLSNPPPAGEVKVQNPADNTLLGILALAGIFGGFAAFEVILLAGAAFTVTARQQQRTLAIIASVGATRPTLFRVLSASGVVLGAIGGIAGVALGIGGGALFMALTNNGSSTRYYGFHLPWLILLTIVAFALLIGWVSALLPARNASRFDIVSALRGARRPPTATIRRPLAGLILCAPPLLRAIAWLMRRSRIGARLASQDAARNPGRSVPALVAIMTTIFVAVFAMAMLSSGEQSSRAQYHYSAALGVVQASPTYQDWSSVGPGKTQLYEHPSALTEAIRSTVPVKDIRTLASVPEPQEVFHPDPANKLSAAAAAKTYAVPVVPPKNLCPISPASPDFSQKLLDKPTPSAVKALQTDPRCSYFYSQSYAQSYVGDMFGVPHIWVGDEGDLAMILGRAPSSDAKRALANGDAISFYPAYLTNNQISIAWRNTTQLADKATSNATPSPVRTTTLDAVIDQPEHPIYFGMFLSPETAEAIGLDYTDSLVMASTTTPTTAQSDALTAAISNLPDNREK